MDSNAHIYMPLDHMDELYNSSNPLIRYVHNDRLQAIMKILEGYESKKILDAGCGEGHLLQNLHSSYAENEYFGLDVTEVAIEQAKKRCPSADIRMGDLKQTDFADGFFDAIICTEVIEHIHNYSLVLDEFKRILSPEGILIITFPNEFLWTMARILLRRKPIKVPDHVNSFSPAKLADEMKMKIIKKQGLPFGLPFVMSLGYLLVAKK